MSLSLTFKGHHITAGVVSYNIELKNHSNNEVWCFSRRYSFLRQVSTQLPPSVQLPINFPPKKFFGNKNPQFLLSRQQGLEKYFKSLIQVQDILESPSIKNFLFPSDRIVLEKPKISEAPENEKLWQRGSILEAKEKSQRVADCIGNRLFDLSSQLLPLEEEEYRNKEKAYFACVSEIRIDRKVCPGLKGCNESVLDGTVGNGQWVERGFEMMIKTFQPVAKCQLKRFLD